jgi:hypothetical protein
MYVSFNNAPDVRARFQKPSLLPPHSDFGGTATRAKEEAAAVVKKRQPLVRWHFEKWPRKCLLCVCCVAQCIGLRWQWEKNAPRHKVARKGTDIWTYFVADYDNWSRLNPHKHSKHENLSSSSKWALQRTNILSIMIQFFILTLPDRRRFPSLARCPTRSCWSRWGRGRAPTWPEKKEGSKRELVLQGDRGWRRQNFNRCLIGRNIVSVQGVSKKNNAYFRSAYYHSLLDLRIYWRANYKNDSS